MQPFGCQICVLGINICFLVHSEILIQIWFISLLLQEYIGPWHYCNLVNIISFGWNDWISYRESSILFVPHFVVSPTFRIAEILLPNLKFPLISWNRISTVLQSDLTKTAAYQTQSSMVHKKHIWYLHPNPGYIKNHYPLKIISAMFVTIHSVNSKSAA